MNLLSWHRFDALLRGTLPPAERVRLLGIWTLWQVLAAAIFGASLGVFSLTARAVPDARFLAASAGKLPLLLLLTTTVTLPSLYVFGTLRGLRFRAREFLAILMVAHTLFAAVLASLGPIIAFFALTTSSYSFMVLLTVAACALGGGIGVRVFVRTINQPPALPIAELPEQPPELREPSASTWQLLGWWVVLYMFVGAQSGWILRPFIGSPDEPFVLFRGKVGGFTAATLHHLWVVMTGG